MLCRGPGSQDSESWWHVRITSPSTQVHQSFPGPTQHTTPDLSLTGDAVCPRVPNLDGSFVSIRYANKSSVIAD